MSTSSEPVSTHFSLSATTIKQLRKKPTIATMAETSPAPSDSKASANDNVIGSGNTQPPTVLAGNSDNGGSGDGEAGGDGPGNVQNQGKFIIL